MIEKLCKQIEERKEYLNDYEELSRQNSLLFLKRQASINQDALFRLLMSATSFSLSEEEKYRRQAYSIAIMSRNILQYAEVTKKKEIEAIIAVILSRLGNFPAETKFIKEVLFDEEILPPTLRLERNYHIMNNQVSIGVDKLIVLTDFQRELWSAMQKHKVVIVNAPTSAGKSYVLQNFVINTILNTKTEKVLNVLYIVPSRALIEQVIIGIKELLKEYGTTNDMYHITEVPQDHSGIRKNIIYILTQERAQLLLETKASVDLVIIDEAQNIADGARGIILQSVVEEIVKRNIKTKIIFAMPFVKNPEVFLSVFHLGEDYAIVPSEESPVKQNLYNVTVKLNARNQVKIEKISESGIKAYLCDIAIDTELVSEDRYLAVLSTKFGNGQNNIIFGSESVKCEKIAQFVIQLLQKKDDPDLLSFSNLLKEHVHKDFLLSETILYGVAYHYGVLPSFIRKEIERLAGLGKINYIVCTSTLLQGINLPAQNIFIMKPSKGRVDNTPGEMTPSEFWNLVGRAGRLTKDYEGNVFLVNLEDWNRKYVDETEKHQIIQSAYNSMISMQKEDLIQFISNNDHVSGAKGSQSYENAFMKLLDTYMTKGSEGLSATLSITNPGIETKSIVEKIAEANETITLPHDLIMQNPNVSAYRQQEMLKYLQKRLAEKGALYLIPPHPMQKWEIIEDSYIRLFARFGKYFKKVKNTNALAIDARLAIKWMKGTPYSEMLADQIRYKAKKRKRGSPNVNTEARALFKKIDSNLRFEYVKFAKCYNDLLAYAIENSDTKEEIPTIPPLQLYLELGASSKTMISFIGMGISRTSACILSKNAVKTNMDENEALEWLRNTNLNALDIPDTVILESNRVIGS